MLLLTAQVAGAQSIYKCTRAGQVEYTDHPCPAGKGELIHQASDSEIIDQYLDLGQDALAKRYADSRHLGALYQQRLDAYQQRMDARAQQQADEALAAKQRSEDARQQALLDAAANHRRLRAENDALRQQNDQYRDQLAQPVYGEAPAYWGAAPPYWDHDHDHDHGPPPKPVFHPCTQLAGGRVQC
ncbi:hypothetical protein B0E48_06150 [Rhodanobacter sp. C03]|nr:hypothetical protein B0E48_06150 [Rhodanobacter sp. C03]